LKKILYPFILRRTKEQVAKDLPDKTETIFIVKWKMSSGAFMKHMK
jgi:SNF2 family DNA or RNA helicase